MDIATKIKDLRTGRGWSQEKLAEKLGVSRQAVTKWETGAGIPDIDNLAQISRVFGISLDELVFGGEAPLATTSFSSVTQLDIVEEKTYDVSVGCARSVRLLGSDGEKLVVRLESATIENLGAAFKVHVDGEGRSFDVDVRSTGTVADATARKELDVVIEIPRGFASEAEVNTNATVCLIQGVTMDVELSGKLSYVLLDQVEGHVEIDVSQDVEVWEKDMAGRLDVNQVGAVSTVHVPAGTAYSARTRGHLGRRTLRHTRNGKSVNAPATAGDAPLLIELAGMRAELTIDETNEAMPSVDSLA